MAAYFKAVLLAIVEGATEFLPVSSTGHLIIVESFIELSPDETFNNAFMIVIQLPAIVAVVFYFWNELWPIAGSGEARRDRLNLWLKIVVGVLPALALGPFLEDFLETNLFAPVPVAIALFVGGVLLIAIERRRHVTRFETVHHVPLTIAFYIGIFQCLAMIPGTSRSAATIIGAMLLGASRPAATEFSFFLAVPTILAAAVYSLVGDGVAYSGEQWGLLAVGSIVSFVVAYAAIAGFMSYIRRRNFVAFGVYRIVLAAAVVTAATLGWID